VVYRAVEIDPKGTRHGSPLRGVPPGPSNAAEDAPRSLEDGLAREPEGRIPGGAHCRSATNRQRCFKNQDLTPLRNPAERGA
jgi:hypothetical protein